MSDFTLEIESGSFSPADWAAIRSQPIRETIGGLDVPIPVPLSLHEPSPRKLDYVLNGVGRIYNGHCGIISRGFEREAYADDPKTFEYNVEPADTRYVGYDNVASGRRSGNAAGLTRPEAVIAAAGELIERYASSFYARDDMVLASYNQLEAAGIKATPPEDYALYLPEAFEVTPALHNGRFTREAQGWWRWGQSLVTGEFVMLPATYCHVPFHLRGETVNGVLPFLDFAVSTGMASHSTLEEAMLRAIYEVVERDALMLTWHHRIPSTGLRLDGATDPDLLEIMELLPSRENWFVTDVSLDIGLTTCFGVYLSPDNRKPYSVVAAATDLNPQKAAARCLKELILGYNGMTDYTLRPPRTPEEKALYAGDFSKCSTLDYHFMLYAAMDLRHEVSFLADKPARWANIEDLPNRATGTVIGDLRQATAAIAEQGLDVIGLDMTTPDIAEIGFKLARVVVPGAQPLDNDHNARHLASRRLREIKRKLGLADRDTDLADLNPAPHPFP